MFVVDMRTDPRHLACFPSVRSEAAAPIMSVSTPIGIIDIDKAAAFTEEDRQLLERVGTLIAQRYILDQI